jgi:hypothetical protein
MNGNAVILCGGKACCPELSITESGKVKIKDDDGNTVTMDKSQAALIDQAIKKIEKKST